MHVNRTKELIKKIANLTKCTFCYKVVVRNFWKVKVPGVWKIGHIPSDHISGYKENALVMIKVQTVGESMCGM
jgi:hypothetical protein